MLQENDEEYRNKNGRTMIYGTQEVAHCSFALDRNIA